MENKVERVKGGVKISFALGAVVTLSLKAAESLGYALLKEAAKQL